ncbi:MAG TPA: methyltransferase domain-containing protein [Polyangiaceae bacterium]|nr:methyltransferase domain-containing protein [Polyangiaceae bacterium]
MVPQQIKDLLFAVNNVAVQPNLWLWRARLKARGADRLHVHLGCGTNYIPGMLNCDGNLMRKVDLWLDLRRPLPFPDASVLVLYTSHTLEHLFPEDALKLFREIHRVVRRDGVARIAVPDLDYAFRIARGEAESLWPRKFDDHAAQAVNYLFCDGQHKYAYNYPLLASFARQVGFTDIRQVPEEQGFLPRPYGDVMLGGEPEGSLVIEVRH